MSTTETAPPHDGRLPVATFGRIVCGVNGSRNDAETVRQAALLGGLDGSLELICVIDESGYGATRQATIARPRAEAALDRAHRQVKELGLDSETKVVVERDVWPALAEAAADRDMIVVGARAGSRAGGIMLGSVATAALHRAALPVLIARPGFNEPFAEILLASDGSSGSQAAARLAARIARVHGSRVTVARVVKPGEDVPADEAADVAGAQREIVVRDAAPRTALVRLAQDLRPSLIVLGSHGKHGVRALGSVSEHVAHHVRCSVLVARGPGGKEHR